MGDFVIYDNPESGNPLDHNLFTVTIRQMTDNRVMIEYGSTVKIVPQMHLQSIKVDKRYPIQFPNPPKWRGRINIAGFCSIPIYWWRRVCKRQTISPVNAT